MELGRLPGCGRTTAGGGWGGGGFAARPERRCLSGRAFLKADER